MNDNQIHTGADNLTHQAMEEALHRRNTAEIRRLLEAGFLLSNAPRTLTDMSSLIITSKS